MDSSSLGPGRPDLRCGEFSASLSLKRRTLRKTRLYREITMQYIKLGSTGLDVSPIAIGAMTYGQPDRGHPVWSLGENDARPLIRHALDAGINFFDTANVYSQGSSEEILGHALRGFANRDDVVIATKLRHPMRSGPNGKGLSRKEVMTEVR